MRACRALVDARSLSRCMSGPGECCNRNHCLRLDTDGDGDVDLEDTSIILNRRSAY